MNSNAYFNFYDNETASSSFNNGNPMAINSKSFTYNPCETNKYANIHNTIEDKSRNSSEYCSETEQAPFSYLNSFLDDEIIQWFLTEINENNKQLKNFTPVTSDELRCFISIIYLLGYLEVPRRRLLWESSPDCHNDLVATAIQRDRFEAILSSLFSCDNLKDTGKAELKINELSDRVNKKLVEYCPIDEQFHIAECSVQSEFQNSKVWCGCSKSGYCNFISKLFHRKNEQDKLNNGQNIIVYYSNVLQFWRPCYYELTFESMYSNDVLLSDLKQLNIEAVPVSRIKSGCVANSNLIGIEKLENNINLYRSTIMRCKKNFSSYVTFCLDVILNNAWILYKNSPPQKKQLDLLSFRRNIVIYYLQRYGRPLINRKMGKALKKGKKTVFDDARYDGIRHYVIPQEKQTRCAKCSMKTTTRCQKCNVGVHVKCFIDFHTKPKIFDRKQ